MVFVSHSISLSKFLFYFILFYVTIHLFPSFYLISYSEVLTHKLVIKNQVDLTAEPDVSLIPLPCHLFLSLIYLFVFFLDYFLFDFQGCVHT